MRYRVGVIGGGQLARMMIIPATNLGLELKVLSEQADSSAKLATSQIGDYTDEATVIEFAQGVDVVTFDHEHVPLTILEKLEQAGISVQPSSKALAHAQNKLVMRQALAKIGAPNPIWKAVSSAAELDSFIKDHGPEVIVKTPIGGYDGKGVRVVKSSSDVSDWLDGPTLASLGGQLLAEQKVSFTRELSQLSARNRSGEFASWPVVETRQRQGVCSEVISPAPQLSATLVSKSVEIAKLISESLDVTGMLAVEMFQTDSGELLVNELAMRPHNSGHFSIEGSVTSQFEQHLRAVLDLPLGSTDAVRPVAVMANLIGNSDVTDYLENYPQIMTKFPGVKIHSYGKSPRVGRKLGHVTVLGDLAAGCLATAVSCRDQLLGINIANPE
jgi:5-(carboxyamino)imidazole ribonucleotide synthase